MTASIEIPTGYQHPALGRLRAYLREVTTELGIGLESCSIDHDAPVSAYVAVDTRLRHYPERDVALLWDERHGWSVAVETHSGEDLVVLRYLGADTVAPPSSDVVAFLDAVRRDDHTVGRLDPPSLRAAAGLDALENISADTPMTGYHCETSDPSRR